MSFKKYTISVSCFQEDIDPISQIFQIFKRAFIICQCPPFPKSINMGSNVSRFIK